jgi:hypothetical protein
MRSTWKQRRRYFLMDTSIFTHRQREQRSKASHLNLKLSLFKALRYMPPTSPVTPGFRCVAVVFARTVVDGEDRGIKPFVLQLHDGQFMTPGVTIKYVSHDYPQFDRS